MWCPFHRFLLPYNQRPNILGATTGPLNFGLSHRGVGPALLVALKVTAPKEGVKIARL